MSGLTPILWAQEFANPALTAFFTAVTNLGSLEFYMFAIPVVYWLIDKHFGFRFALHGLFPFVVSNPSTRHSHFHSFTRAGRALRDGTTPARWPKRTHALACRVMSRLR